MSVYSVTCFSAKCCFGLSGDFGAQVKKKIIKTEDTCIPQKLFYTNIDSGLSSVCGCVCVRAWGGLLIYGPKSKGASCHVTFLKG